MRRQGGQLGRVELRRNLFAAAEDHEAIVNAFQQRSYIAEMRVIAALALKGSGQAYEVVVVVQVARARALDLLRIAAEMQRRRGQRNLRCRAPRHLAL